MKEFATIELTLNKLSFPIWAWMGLLFLAISIASISINFFLYAYFKKRYDSATQNSPIQLGGAFIKTTLYSVGIISKKVRMNWLNGYPIHKETPTKMRLLSYIHLTLAMIGFVILCFSLFLYYAYVK